MPRSLQLATVVALLVVLGCRDTDPTAIQMAGAPSLAVTPTGSLDQNVTTLIGLFPHGLSKAASARWTEVKRKQAAGVSDPKQLKVAKQLLVELSAWVQKMAPEMSDPPGGESKSAAAARLVLYMSLYVYNGPSTPAPSFLPTADATVGIITPQTETTLVTPAKRAGVDFEQGSVAENTIVVITQNPTPYPDECSGPLATKLCQYPQFYKFEQFPHTPLQKPATFAVCHVNSGTSRDPLADHDRFRLAHDKPANPADYTPGSTIRDDNGESIEILPYKVVEFTQCLNTSYAAAAATSRVARLAKHIGRLLTPKLAYAVDQGGGGESISFSSFNNVDPYSAPDHSVSAVSAPAGAVHPGDDVPVTYTVSNGGTATGTSVPVKLRLSTDNVISVTDPVVGSATIPALTPGATTTQTTQIAMPAPLALGGYYIGVVVDSDLLMPDEVPSNNTQSMALPVSLSRRMAVGESTVCALNAASAVYCWGQNNGPFVDNSSNLISFWQYGASATAMPTSASPLAVPAPPTPLDRMAGGMSHHFCGIAGSNAAVCWGRGGSGQLGSGIPGNTGNAATLVTGGISWAEINVGRLNTCGVSTSGDGYCWGFNQRGVVGHPSVPIGAVTTSPQTIAGGHTFKQVVSGWLHACGITTTGAAYCWGDNQFGQLGIGFSGGTVQASPVAVAGGHQFIQLSLGALHTCGITTGQQAYCWGANGTGQVGDGTTAHRPSPTQVSGQFSYIAVGSGFGDGSAVAVPLGTLVGGIMTTAGQISGGVSHTCALALNGTAYCWGWNGNGQIGDGTTLNRLAPVPVSGSLVFTGLGLGGSASCGIRGRKIWCWGSNAVGQLGSGSFTSSLIPSKVLAPF